MTTRRAVLALAGAAMLGRPAGAMGGTVMPPEWAPHAACVMAWCAAIDSFTPDEIARIHAEQAQIAQAIAGFEPVIMLANRRDLADARRACGPTVRVEDMAVTDSWTRDTLPSFAAGLGGLVATGWNFNV